MLQDVPRITPDEYAQRLDQCDDIYLLVVRRGSYDRSDTQTEGSLRIEPDALEDEFEQIPAGSEVVTYCT